MLKMRRKYSYGPEVFAAVDDLAEVSGLPRWLAKNIILWRVDRGLSVTMAKVLS